MKRAGVFDPWRQTATSMEAAETRLPTLDERTAAAETIDENIEGRRLLFLTGKQTTVSIDIPASQMENAAYANNQLGRALELVPATTLAKHNIKVTMGLDMGAMNIRGEKRYFAVKGVGKDRGTNTADAVGLALIEAGRDAALATSIKALGVHVARKAF